MIEELIPVQAIFIVLFLVKMMMFYYSPLFIFWKGDGEVKHEGYVCEFPNYLASFFRKCATFDRAENGVNLFGHRNAVRCSRNMLPRDTSSDPVQRKGTKHHEQSRVAASDR